MCILFIYVNPNPSRGGYRLIVASNRDEFYKRPAKNAYLCQRTQIVGGRDMTDGREGGMWLGVGLKKTKLSFAALLNVTGEEKKTSHEVKGRGPIVYDYLAEDPATTPLSYFETLKSPKNYNAFNVVVVEICKQPPDDGVVTYHHSNSPLKTHEYRGEQILAFGNSTPECPLSKVRNGRVRFEHIVETMATDRQSLIDSLLTLLKSRERNLPDPELERRAPGAFEELSSIYVEIAEGYGTRTHSVILVGYDYDMEFIEHTMKAPIDSKNPQWDINVIKSRL